MFARHHGAITGQNPCFLHAANPFRDRGLGIADFPRQRVEREARVPLQRDQDRAAKFIEVCFRIQTKRRSRFEI